MRRPNSGRLQKKPSAGASNNGRIDGACVCVRKGPTSKLIGKRCHKFYRYSAIPNIRELFDCPSYAAVQLKNWHLRDLYSIHPSRVFKHWSWASPLHGWLPKDTTVCLTKPNILVYRLHYSSQFKVPLNGHIRITHSKTRVRTHTHTKREALSPLNM